MRVMANLLYHVIQTQLIEEKNAVRSVHHIFNSSYIPMAIIGIKTSKYKPIQKQRPVNTNQFKNKYLQCMHFYSFTWACIKKETYF